jgi:multidrug efflux pump subunit AcrB
MFVPSFFMTGVSRSLFVPLTLAVGFAMAASFLLSGSLVPVLAIWWLGKDVTRVRATPARDWVDRLRDRIAWLLRRLAPVRGWLPPRTSSWRSARRCSSDARWDARSSPAPAHISSN